MNDFDCSWCEDLVRDALEEDIGTGDVTSRSVVDPGADVSAYLITRAAGTIAGLPVAEMTFRLTDKSIVFQPLVLDGNAVGRDTRIALIEGPAVSILAAERTALNFLQQLSGVATEASRYVAVASRYGVVIKDTRKTIPGFRRLQKYAASMGGCENHRTGLWDQILIKDNHLQCRGGDRLQAIKESVAASRAARPNLKIEVEVEDIAQFRTAVETGADIIMLDNVNPDIVRQAVHIVESSARRPIIEVSGGITLENLEAVAKERPDWVSVGSITHSSPAIDISLEFTGDSR